MTISPEPLRETDLSRNAKLPLVCSNNTAICEILEDEYFRGEKQHHHPPRKDTSSPTLFKSATTGHLPTLEKGIMLWNNLYLFDPGTPNKTPNNYVTIPYMGQSGSQLASMVNECMKAWLTDLSKSDDPHSTVRSSDVVRLKDALFCSLTKDLMAISIFDKIVIKLKVGKVSRDLKSIPTGEFDELFLRVSHLLDREQ